MSTKMSERDARLLCEAALIKRLTNPQGKYWSRVVEILENAQDIRRLNIDLEHLSRSYFRDINIGLYNKARENNLNKIAKLIDQLMTAIDSERDWLISNLDFLDSEHLGAEDFLREDEINPIISFKILLLRAMRDASRNSGIETIHARRRAWIYATNIYEEIRDCRAAVSKDKDGQIFGPFVDFVLSISMPIMYMEKISPNMIDQFIDWYRDPVSLSDREEVAERRAYWLARQASQQG